MNIDKILVANRGEITIRIIRACRTLQISPIVIYSEEDRRNLHIRMADGAFNLGSGNLHDTYMNSEKIINAALQFDVDAIHPGYSFLADNSVFAKKVIDAGLKWIGPSPETLQKIENKLDAKRLAEKAGFKTLLDSGKTINNFDEARKAASELGYPIILKPCFGSGGIGLEIVRREEQLEKAMRRVNAQSSILAKKEVFIEQYVSNLQLFEVGFLTDSKTQTICFPEREITIQHKLQKLVGESPSTFLSEESRTKIFDLIKNYASILEFQCIGNIEVLYKKGLGLVFDEINPHIQLEHPLTEMTTGIDIVCEQIQIANDQPIKWTQEEIKPTGFAMQFRINAEDPLNNFQPSSGEVKELGIPGGPWIRFDTNIYRGYQIPMLYDTYLGQLLVYSTESRELVRKRALSALNELTITGFPTTIGYHRHLIAHPDFVKGKFTTNFIEKQSDIIREIEEEMRSIIAALFTTNKETSKVTLPPLSKSRWRDYARSESTGRGI